MATSNQTTAPTRSAKAALAPHVGSETASESRATSGTPAAIVTTNVICITHP